MNKTKLSRVIGIPLLLFLITFVLYAFMASRSVFGGDSGDFLAAIAVRGVPHPSGYPLYTMIGIIFGSLPFTGSLAWKVGLASALFSSLSLVCVYLTLRRLGKNVLVSVIASLSLAFVFPFWLYAEITEVMALQHFLISFILYIAIMYRQTKNTHILYAVAFLCGLSLTNNQTMLLFFPVVFVLVFGVMLHAKRFLRVLLFCIQFFIVGLLPYLYLPIAASFDPPVNWNNPVTVQAFLQIALRQDYGWIPKVIVDNSVKLLLVKRYLLYLLSEMTFLGILLIGIGIAASFWQKKQLVVPFAFLLGFILFGPFFFYYGATPTFATFSDGAREKFAASSIIFLIMFIPFGIEAAVSFAGMILEKINASTERITVYQKVITLFFLILPLILFLKNVNVLDLRDKTRIADIFAKDLLTSLPKNTVLIAQHDNVLFPVWYVEYATGVRQDIYATLPGELMDLARRGVIHLQTSKLRAVLKNDPDPDNQIHDVALQLPTTAVISESDYHSFIKDKQIVLYPYGLVLKYATLSDQKMSKSEFVRAQNERLEKLSTPTKLMSLQQKDRLWLLRSFPLFYAHAYSNTGYFLMYAYKDYALARKYFQKAIQIDEGDHWAYEGLGITYYQQKNYKRAQDAFRKAVAIEPLNHNAYFLLYGTYLALKDNEEAKELEAFFKEYSEIYSEFNKVKTRVRVPR